MHLNSKHCCLQVSLWPEAISHVFVMMEVHESKGQTFLNPSASLWNIFAPQFRLPVRMFALLLVSTAVPRNTLPASLVTSHCLYLIAALDCVLSCSHCVDAFLRFLKLFESNSSTFCLKKSIRTFLCTCFICGNRSTSPSPGVQQRQVSSRCEHVPATHSACGPSVVLNMIACFRDGMVCFLWHCDNVD